LSNLNKIYIKNMSTIIQWWRNLVSLPWCVIIDNVYGQIWMPKRDDFDNILFGFLLIFFVFVSRARQQVFSCFINSFRIFIQPFRVDFKYIFIWRWMLIFKVLTFRRWECSPLWISFFVIWIWRSSVLSEKHVQINRAVVLHSLFERFKWNNI